MYNLVTICLCIWKYLLGPARPVQQRQVGEEPEPYEQENHVDHVHCEVVLRETESIQDDLSRSGAGEVLPGAGDGLHARPLVHQQSLVAVVEPRQVRYPAQVWWYGTSIQEESSEQHEGDDDGRSHGRRHADAVAGT